MKTIALGDIHGHDTWKDIVAQEVFDKLIFIGDYFDSFDNGHEKQINNFLDICMYKEKSDKEVIMLIGNHDYHYFKGVGDTGTSGYQHNAKYMIEMALDNHKDKLQMAYSEGKYLFTHAGVGETFLEITGYQGPVEIEKITEYINDLWKYRPLSFIFTGSNPYGDNVCQTPIWIRPRSLRADAKKLEKNGIIQVVGHTGQDQIFLGEYIFIDVLGRSKEFLIIEDGKASIGKIKPKKDDESNTTTDPV